MSPRASSSRRGRWPLTAAILLLAAVLAQGRAAAASGADFLGLEPGARPAGMGGAFTAVADDANAVRWNPAGLRQLPRPEATFAERNFMGDLRLYEGAVAGHLGRSWSAGVGVSFLDYGKIDRVNNLGAGTNDSYGARDILLTFAGARDVPRTLLGGRLRLGSAFKLIRREIETESANGYAFDVAGHWEEGRWRAGASLQNMGPSIGFRRDSTGLPLAFRLGAAYEAHERVLLAIDALHRDEKRPSARLGAEVVAARVQWTDLLVRAGFSTAEGVEHGVSAGLGLVGLNWEFSYSWKMLGDLDFAHWIGVTYRFRPWQARVTPQEFSRRRAEAMYDRLMRWYEAQRAGGRLSKKGAIEILERLIARYDALGVDVSDARHELDRVKAQPEKQGLAPRETVDEPQTPSLDPLLEGTRDR